MKGQGSYGGKFTPKGKGKGQFQSEGGKGLKGGWTAQRSFAGYCLRCGRWGHKVQTCRVVLQIGADYQGEPQDWSAQEWKEVIIGDDWPEQIGQEWLDQEIQDDVEPCLFVAADTPIEDPSFDEECLFVQGNINAIGGEEIGQHSLPSTATLQERLRSLGGSRRCTGRS